MKMSCDSTLTFNTAGRTTTAQSQSTVGRMSTAKGRTRKQIIAEFFWSQNWRYLAKKAIMVKHEREQTKECIVKYRRFKLGMKKFWKVYKVWIAKVKLQRKIEQEKAKEEEENLEEIKITEEPEHNEILPMIFDDQWLNLQTQEPNLPIEEAKRWEFVLSEDDDIFTVNEGIDLSKFKENKNASYEYDKNLKAAKEKNYTKWPKKLDIIEEDPEESVVLSPFQKKVGKLLAIKIEIAWERKMRRREGKKLRELLKNLPPQCRTSYVKLMQLKNETADLQSHVTKHSKY